MKWLFTSLIVTYNCLALAEQPLVIAHRGASGYRPEHTWAAYELAMQLGADYIEIDLVSTKDGVLIARHENELSETTNVADKFPHKKTTKIIDGQSKTGYFSEDFTLEELLTLNAKERLDFRNSSYHYQFPILTLDSLLAKWSNYRKQHALKVGVYIELKHPSYFRSIGLPLEDKLLRSLEQYQLNQATSPIFIQCFELSSLSYLKNKTKAKLIYLLETESITPYDHVIKGDSRTYGDMMQPNNLALIAKIAYGIGPNKRSIIPEVNGVLQQPTALVQEAHKVGLKVHPYTFRNESYFLHSSYNTPKAEYQAFRSAGVDGFFTDFPDTALQSLQE